MDAEAEEAVNKVAKPDGFPSVPTQQVPLREDQISNAVAFLAHPKVPCYCLILLSQPCVPG